MLSVLLKGILSSLYYTIVQGKCSNLSSVPIYDIQKRNNFQVSLTSKFRNIAVPERTVIVAWALLGSEGGAGL